MIQYFSSDAEQLTPISTPDISVNTPSWINVEAPTKTEINTLTKMYQLPQHYFNAILDDQENSRVIGLDETNDGPLMILMQYPKFTTSPLGYLGYSTYPIAFILTDSTIITVSNHPAAFIQHFVMYQNSLGKVITSHEDFISHILWFISHDFVTALQSTSKKMNRLERQLTTATKNEQIYQIMALQKTLIEFDAALQQNQPVLKKISSGDQYFSTNELNELSDQTLIENDQAITMTNNQSQILDQYSNMVSSVVSNNLNDVMKILTSITLILTVPTIIGGLYGMNVNLPGAQMASAFTWIMIATIIICLITLHVLRHHDYM
ncbi:Mg2+ and Co2+ transport protein [Paucilactobacillus hokkaidonensis JCM 18461]|uniref:Mg2+ and Co2+ transport protein n=3 Tax=Paucilactobacillus hokkaidonensis TaxID=1193095 RepID=A0A0A1GYD4_9LACO|nr:magnesium transporter CorA family protein [Paucilactobacillus hokkaidonensis]KRO09943.1 Mg2+ and Co2+ transport protein [Paucilactobacillus hokkaidonensis]BAP85924.1 Mg2+ and Co2+ transport protein [Paucilactobacillus hokkaidonensis JCM 18461]